MLNRFTLRPFTYSTFAMSGNLGKKMIPFPLICDLLPSPKVTLPPFLDSKTLKRERSPVMCREHPLSRYHKHVSITLNANFIIKHTSCFDDKSIGMVFFFICHLQPRPLTFTRVVHGSVRVGFVPNPEPTRRNRVAKKCTRRRPPE